MKLPVKYSSLDWRKGEKRIVREEYERLQEGKCYYCKCELKGPPAEEVAQKPITKSLFPDGFWNHPVHLHHSHDTDMTLGVVHCYCNAVLWEYEGE